MNLTQNDCCSKRIYSFSSLRLNLQQQSRVVTLGAPRRTKMEPRRRPLAVLIRFVVRTPTKPSREAGNGETGTKGSLQSKGVQHRDLGAAPMGWRRGGTPCWGGVQGGGGGERRRLGGEWWEWGGAFRVLAAPPLRPHGRPPCGLWAPRLAPS